MRYFYLFILLTISISRSDCGSVSYFCTKSALYGLVQMKEVNKELNGMGVTKKYSISK